MAVRMGIERLNVRVALVAVSAAFYAITFVPLHQELGPGVVSLSVVPVALAAWLFGLRAGLLAGAVAFPLNTVLLGLEDGADLDSVVWGGAVAGSAALMVGSVAGTLRDVTDRLRAELARRWDVDGSVRASESTLRELVEHAPAMIMAVGKDGTVTYANRAIGGLDAASVRGANVYNFVPRQHRDLFRTALERAFREGGETGYEIAGGADEEPAVLHVLRFGPVKKDGHVVATTLLSIDVSESHR